MRSRIPASLAGLVVAVACTNPPADRDAAGAADSAPAPAAATRVSVVSGFQTPESARHYPTQDVYFVSNMPAGPSGRANNGYISRLRSDGTVDSMRFIQGGRGGVTLNSPKGMALIGDTLWVADIDMVRAFNARTGAPVTSVNLRGRRAVLLNDVAAGPDGSVYITDSGVRFDPDSMRHPGPDRIFRIDPRRNVTVAAEGAMLDMPNGIAWDAAGNRFLLGGIREEAAVLTWHPDSAGVDTLVTGPGGYDGIEAVGDGSFLVTSFRTSSVYRLRNDSLELIADSMASPADIGWDPGRRQLVIPMLAGNTVEIWKLP